MGVNIKETESEDLAWTELLHNGYKFTTGKKNTIS
jgi:hypothetical protein